MSTCKGVDSLGVVFLLILWLEVLGFLYGKFRGRPADGLSGSGLAFSLGHQNNKKLFLGMARQMVGKGFQL